MSIEFDHCIGFSLVPGSLHFHPNGENYLYCAGGVLVIANLTHPHHQVFLRKHDQFLTAATLSPYGSYVATGQSGENSDVYVWDFATREIMFSLEEHDYKIQDVAFTQDEKILTTLGSTDDHKMLLWDMSTGNIVAANSKMPGGTTILAHGGFLKDIKRRETQNYQFCTGGMEGLLFWVLDPYTGDLHCEPLVFDGRPSFSRQITGLQFYDNNDNICAATSSGDYLLANVRARKIIKAIPATNLGLGAILAYEGGVIVGGGDSTVKFFDHTQHICGQARVHGAVVAMSFSPDKLEVIVGTASGSIVRLNLESMEYMVLSESHTSSVVALSFASDLNDRFATASKDGSLRIWDAVEYMVLATAYARSSSSSTSLPLPQCLVFSHTLLSGWSDGKILSHDADTGEYLWSIEQAHPEGVTAICESNNSRFILSGGQTGEVRLWETRSRDLISNLKEHTQRITSLAIFEDDSQAISCGRDKSILRWDLRSERRQFCHTQRMGGINSIALARDQRTILSVGQERKMTFWDVITTAPVQVQPIDGDSDEGLSIALSHDNTMIATGGVAGVLYVLDYESGEEIFRRVAHSGAITGVAYSPDDKQIVTTGEDGCVNIWCVFTS